MDTLDGLRLREAQQIVITLQLLLMILKSFASKVGLSELMLLDHGSHGAIQDVNTLRESITQI